MVQNIPFPYQNTQVSKSDFQYPSNNQSYAYLNNQKYQTSRPHMETYLNNYSQQDNRDNIQYNFWQHQSSQNTTKLNNGLQEYSNLDNYIQSQRNGMQNYNLPNNQRRSFERNT